MCIKEEEAHIYIACVLLGGYVCALIQKAENELNLYNESEFCVVFVLRLVFFLASVMI